MFPLRVSPHIQPVLAQLTFLKPASFDNTQNAAINETPNAPTITTTTNTMAHGPQTHAPLPAATTATTATHATATTDETPATDAPGYLQQAREALVSLAGTAQNAMGIGMSLPLGSQPPTYHDLFVDTPSSTLQSLANNTKIEASMPTSEATGAAPGEHVGGVGALPGNASEEGVARLPAERTSVPSRELEGSYPGEKTSGVGALPGSLNESGVALLPDERGKSFILPGLDASNHWFVYSCRGKIQCRGLCACCCPP